MKQNPFHSAPRYFVRRLMFVCCVVLVEGERLILLEKADYQVSVSNQNIIFEETSILEDFDGNGWRKYCVYRFLSLQLQGYDK